MIMQLVLEINNDMNINFYLLRLDEVFFSYSFYKNSFFDRLIIQFVCFVFRKHFYSDNTNFTTM